MIPINEYFDGKVKSLAYETKNGKATVGVMEDGEYEFGTGSPEIMTVIEGHLKVCLENQQEYINYTDGQQFKVPGNSKFKVKSIGQTSYCCQFK